MKYRLLKSRAKRRVNLYEIEHLPFESLNHRDELVLPITAFTTTSFNLDLEAILAAVRQVDQLPTQKLPFFGVGRDNTQPSHKSDDTQQAGV